VVSDIWCGRLAWEYQIGLEYVGHLLQLDPLHEGAHYQKMYLLAASGQRYAALAQYEHYCQLLADELGVEPAAETTTLCEQLRAGKLCPGNWPAIASTPILPAPVASLLPCPYQGRCLLAKMIDLLSLGTRYSRRA